jgi:predicted nucleotidyltransferase
VNGIFLGVGPPWRYLDRMSETDDPVARLRAALPALRQAWPIRSLAVFGSRSRADARADSDLDVLVEFAEPVPLSAFLALEQHIAVVAGVPVDLVSAASLKPLMGERIRAEAIAL